MPEWMVSALAAFVLAGWTAFVYCIGVSHERLLWERGKGWRTQAAYQVTVRDKAERIARAGRNDRGTGSSTTSHATDGAVPTAGEEG